MMRVFARCIFACLMVCCLAEGAAAQQAAPAAKPKKKPAADVQADQAKKKAAQAKKRKARAAARKKAAEMAEEAAQAAIKLQQANLVNQFHPQYERLFKVELAFVKRICKLSDEQQKQLSELAGPALINIAGGNVAGDAAKLRVVQQQVAVRRRGIPANPRKNVQKAIANLLEEHFSENFAATYQNEIDARNESHKRASALFLVGFLDERLVLTEEQRTKLTDVLMRTWQDDWFRAIRYMRSNNHYFPTVPDRSVSKHLTPRQKLIWRGIQKVNFGRNHNEGFDVGNVVVDDFEIVAPKPDQEDPVDADAEAADSE